MRFAVGQAYESVDGKNQAVVTQIRDDGRAGLLRINGGREEWFIKRENGAWLGQALHAERALSCGGHSMAKDHEWEELQAERPTGGYATLLHRMRVPGGYIYKDTTMYLRGFFGPKFTTSLVFVPDMNALPPLPAALVR